MKSVKTFISRAQTGVRILQTWIVAQKACCRPAVWPAPSPGSLSPRLKLSGREVHRLPQSGAEVKNAWSYICIPPYIFMTWCLINHMGSFTLICWWLKVMTLRCSGCDLQNEEARHVTLRWLWDSIKLQALQETRRYAVPFSAVRKPWNTRWRRSLYVITITLLDSAFRRRLVAGFMIQGHVMWDLWWTKWHWGWFSHSISVSPASFHFTNCFTFITQPIFDAM
jgi:hypothetical protein